MDSCRWSVRQVDTRVDVPRPFSDLVMTDGATTQIRLLSTQLVFTIVFIPFVNIYTQLLSFFARDLQLYCCCNRSTNACPILQAIYAGRRATYRRFKANVVISKHGPAMSLESVWIFPAACPDAGSYETATPANVAQERQSRDSDPDDRF